MKIPIKCFEFLTNKGNGRKCKLAPLINGRHQDCVFKKNGMIQSSTNEVKARYLYTLAKRCHEWHDRKKKMDHYLVKIKPQIDDICINICQQAKKE